MDIAALVTSFIALLILILTFALAGLILLSLDKVPRIHKVLAHRQHRELLRHKVYQYRLASMLRYLGIPMDFYISNLPEDEIKKHIYRCDRCPNIETCDRCVRDGEKIKDMRFCPNYESIIANKPVT
jgi:hypothetical protein